MPSYVKTIFANIFHKVCYKIIVIPYGPLGSIKNTNPQPLGCGMVFLMPPSGISIVYADVAQCENSRISLTLRYFVNLIFVIVWIFRAGENLVKVDLTNIENIDNFIKENKPDVLIHAAAQRFPDKMQQNPEASRKLNVDATNALASSMSKSARWF